MAEFTVQDETNKLAQWCMGDRHAMQFLLHAFEVTQIADDFADGDKPERLTSEYMTRLLHMSFVEIPNNPFYQAYREALWPVLSSCFLTWNATNQWEKSAARTSRMFAYVNRETCEQLIHLTAYLLGGQDHARAVVLDVHAFYHGDQDTEEPFEIWESKR